MTLGGEGLDDPVAATGDLEGHLATVAADLAVQVELLDQDRSVAGWAVQGDHRIGDEGVGVHARRMGARRDT